MTFLRSHLRIVLVALSCVAVGAGASAIATAGASTSGSAAHLHAGHHGRRGRGMRVLRRAVHAQLVVPTKQGFVTVTVDRGTVQSVSGSQLTMTEGTRKQTYKTVTLTVPANAKVRDNRQAGSLSSLQAGQRVIVVTAPKRTLVIAHTPRTHG